MKISTFATVLSQTKHSPADIDLLSLNCEGCEVALLETLLSQNYIESIPEVQLSWHPLDTIPNVKERRCRIRAELSRTHDLYYSFHFSWESWVRKDLRWW